MEANLEKAKLQSRVVSWRWLDTCRANSSGTFDQQTARMEFYFEGDGQPGKDFQQDPVSESTQGPEGKWARKRSLKAGVPEAIVIFPLQCLSLRLCRHPVAPSIG